MYIYSRLVCCSIVACTFYNLPSPPCLMVTSTHFFVCIHLHFLTSSLPRIACLSQDVSAIYHKAQTHVSATPTAWRSHCFAAYSWRSQCWRLTVIQCKCVCVYVCMYVCMYLCATYMHTDQLLLLASIHISFAVAPFSFFHLHLLSLISFLPAALNCFVFLGAVSVT